MPRKMERQIETYFLDNDTHVSASEPTTSTAAHIKAINFNRGEQVLAFIATEVTSPYSQILYECFH